MEQVNLSILLNQTIKTILLYLEKDTGIIFQFKHGTEFLMKTPSNCRNIVTKNREPIDLFKIENLEIADVDWYGSFKDIDGLLIIDKKGDVYRFQCKKDDSFTKNALYNYTKYKLQKEENSKKIKNKEYYQFI